MITFLPQFADRIRVRFLGKKDDRNIADPFVRLHQMHGNVTAVTREPSNGTLQADGVLTDVTGLHLIARAADCQNFCVYHPEKHIAGVLHAGWKGILAGAIPAFFAKMRDEFDAHAEETFVIAGPSLCLQCAEYADPSHALRTSIDKRFVHDDCVDLQGAATMQLLDAGVPRDHIYRHPDCTRCDPKQYLTYRGGDKELVESGVSNFLVCTLL